MRQVRELIGGILAIIVGVLLLDVVVTATKTTITLPIGPIVFGILVFFAFVFYKEVLR